MSASLVGPAPEGMPDPAMAPPQLARSGDPFAALRVVHFVSRLRRNESLQLRDVVAALNANPDSSAILWAATYRGNAGTGIVQPSAVVHLSDFLWAPRPGDAGVDPGYQIPRVPYQQYILRICKL